MVLYVEYGLKWNDNEKDDKTKMMMLGLASKLGCFEIGSLIWKI